MKRFLTFLVVGSLLCLLSSVTAWAQGATAQISGTVKDESGAVLPGAEVTVTQTETGATRMAVSSETGSYVLPNLPVGPYKLEVSLPGFPMRCSPLARLPRPSRCRPTRQWSKRGPRVSAR